MSEKVIHTTDLKELSRSERFLLFLFVILPGNHTVDCPADFIRRSTGTAPNMSALRGGIDNLGTKGYLEEGVTARGVNGRACRLVATFSLRALLQLAVEATRASWWPTRTLIDSGAPGSWLGMELAFGVRNFVDAKQVWQVAETLRMLMVGGTCAGFGVQPNAAYPLASVYAAAVGRLLEVLEAGVPVSTETLDASAVEQLLPMLLEHSFLEGRDVRPILEGAHRLLALPGARPTTAFLCAYCACCVWTGRRDLLNGAVGFIPRGAPAETFATLCLDVFEGRLVEAEKAFASHFASFQGVFPSDVSTPVCLLGMALALRVGSGLVHAGKYAAELKREPDTLKWHPAGRSVFREALRRRTDLVGRLLRGFGEEKSPRVAVPPDLAQILPPVQGLFLAGYPTLAAIELAEIRRAFPDDASLNEFAVLLERSGAVPLAKTFVREEPWQIALNALDQCLPLKGAAAQAERAAGGTVYWNLAFVISACEGEMIYACARLVPVYRGPRAREDGRDDRRLTLKALSGAKYRSCLTSCDAEVLQVLLRVGYEPRVINTVPDEALELLCGHPHLVTSELGQVFAENVPHSPITLEQRPCELTTTRGAAGEMHLQFPRGLLGAVQQGRTYAIRREDEGHYIFQALPKKVRDVVNVFIENGENGALTLPEAAIPQAKNILMRLAGYLSISGAFAVWAEEFTRTAGNPMPHVRLVYANETLSLALVVEPLPNRAVAACEPGMGHAERLVSLRGGRTVLLARDLAAEEARAETVRAALVSLDAWATGRNRWLVTNAEAALDALRILKELEGVQLDWPEGEKLHVRRPSAQGVRIRASGTDWFALDGDVTFDDGRVVSLLELLRALENREGNYVRFGERDYLYLSSELLRRLEALGSVVTKGEGAAVANRIAPAAVPMLERAFEGGDETLPKLPEILAERAERIRTAFAEEVAVPRGFKGTLRDYQVKGYEWLEHLAACGFGACLADDMGLGKTVQIIALLLRRAQDGASLVVAPASVCPNWVREIARFAPDLHVVTLWDEKSLPENLGAGDVVVASYGLLVARMDHFTEQAWNGVVLDEAQNVKNAATQRAQSARRLRARFRIAATGTPVENRLTEFWSIFSFLNPGLLGTEQEFAARFTEAGFATKTLKRIVEPFVLRRLKRNVLQELPEKTEITLRVQLGEEERAAYEACRREAQAKLAEQNSIEMLAALTRLRRFCCHPSLVFPEMKMSAKLDAVLDLMGELRAAGHRALVFSQFVDYLTIVREAVAAKGWMSRYLDGATAQADRVAAVDAFQRGDGDFFLISLKAGGFGLNLTAANYVLLLDPWWNPAVEDQAADRVYRIGQKLPVTVYRIVAEKTVEERILDLHNDKRAVSEDLLASATGSTLTPECLRSLFS